MILKEEKIIRSYKPLSLQTELKPGDLILSPTGFSKKNPFNKPFVLLKHDPKYNYTRCVNIEDGEIYALFEETEVVKIEAYVQEISKCRQK